MSNDPFFDAWMSSHSTSSSKSASSSGDDFFDSFMANAKKRRKEEAKEAKKKQKQAQSSKLLKQPKQKQGSSIWSKIGHFAKGIGEGIAEPFEDVGNFIGNEAANLTGAADKTRQNYLDMQKSNLHLQLLAKKQMNNKSLSDEQRKRWANTYKSAQKGAQKARKLLKGENEQQEHVTNPYRVGAAAAQLGLDALTAGAGAELTGARAGARAAVGAGIRAGAKSGARGAIKSAIKAESKNAAKKLAEKEAEKTGQRILRRTANGAALGMAYGELGTEESSGGKATGKELAKSGTIGAISGGVLGGVVPEAFNRYKAYKLSKNERVTANEAESKLENAGYTPDEAKEIMDDALSERVLTMPGSPKKIKVNDASVKKAAEDFDKKTEQKATKTQEPNEAVKSVQQAETPRFTGSPETVKLKQEALKYKTPEEFVNAKNIEARKNWVAENYGDRGISGKSGSGNRAAGFQAAATRRALTGKLTPIEYRNAEKYLNSNYIGKKVPQGEVVGTAFGKIRIKTPSGEIISKFPDEINSPKATPSEVREYAAKKAGVKLNASVGSLSNDAKKQLTDLYNQAHAEAKTTPKQSAKTGQSVVKKPRQTVDDVIAKDKHLKDLNEVKKQIVDAETEGIREAHKPVEGGVRQQMGKHSVYVGKNGLPEDYRDLPVYMRTKNPNAPTLDTWATNLGFDSEDDLLKAIEENAPKKQITKTEARKQAISNLENGSGTYSEDYKQINEAIDDREADLKRLVEETKVKPGRPKTAGALKPLAGTSTSEKGVSQLAKKVNAKALKEKIINKTQAEDLPEYNKANMSEQAGYVADLIKNDPQSAIDIALGKKAPPPHILQQMVYNGVEEHARTIGGDDGASLLLALAKSKQVSNLTVMAQNVRAAAERDPHSPTNMINEVKVARIKKLKGGKEALSHAEKADRKAIKAATPKVTKETWESFIEGLQC